MAPPKTVLDKVCAAIEKLAEPGGSSRIAIAKFLKSEYATDNAVALKKAFKQGVDAGRLVQEGQRFAVAGLVFEEPEDEKLKVEEVKPGKDGAAVAEKGDTVRMAYRGTLLEDGSEFDKAKSFEFTLGAGEVIKGWDLGIAGMAVGAKRKLVIPAKLGYGKRGSPPEIPGGATLCFDVELLAIV